MKKIVLTCAMTVFALAAYAQNVTRDVLNGYKEGDKLEKSVYSKEDPIQQNVWCGAFSAKPNGAPSPTIGKELVYEGYHEKGPSINFGGFEKGARFSVYSLTDGKKNGRGTLYLACLVNFSKLGLGGMADFLGVSPSFKGGSNRASIYVAREGGDRIRFGASLLKMRADTEMTYEYNKTHLLVLKLDYSNQKVLLFVNPELGAAEPEKADVVVEGTEGTQLKHAIRGIAFRNRANYVGNIGNFRWTNNWAGIIAE